MAEWPLSKSPTSQPDPRGLVITGDRHSMPGDTVMIQRSGIPLLARSEAHQQGASDSASHMDRPPAGDDGVIKNLPGASPPPRAGQPVGTTGAPPVIGLQIQGLAMGVGFWYDGRSIKKRPGVLRTPWGWTCDPC
jgi:hypothetical protein